MRRADKTSVRHQRLVVMGRRVPWGHGVGAKSDGNSWSRSNTYTNFKTESETNWGKKLFDEKAAAAKVKGMKKSKVLAPKHARRFLTRYVRDGKGVAPKGWTRKKAATFIADNYADQKLLKYARSKSSSGDDYKFDGDNNVVGGRVYVWLSRNNNRYTSYTEAAWKEKVSWYSLSSPEEWFAEQFSAHSRSGGMDVVDVVEKKLDVIAKQQYKKGKLRNPPKASGSGAGGGQSGASDSGGGPQGGAEQDAGERPPEDARRTPFAW